VPWNFVAEDLLQTLVVLKNGEDEDIVALDLDARYQFAWE